MVETVPGLGNGSGVGQHAEGAVDGSKLAARNTHWLLVVDSELESSWAPFNKVEGGLGLESGNGSSAVAWNDITTVQKGNSHVLSVAWVTDDHLVVWLEACIDMLALLTKGQTSSRRNKIRTLEGKVMDLEGLVGASVAGDNRSVADQWVVDTWVGHQVGLELVEIDVESTIESERGGDGADNLSDQTVEMLVSWTGDVKVTVADVVDCLVVDQEGTVRVLNGAVGGENGVVWLNNGGRDTWSWVDSEFQLGLLSVVGGETLKEESTETRTGTATEGVEDQESLESRAVVCIRCDALFSTDQSHAREGLKSHQQHDECGQ